MYKVLVMYSFLRGVDICYFRLSSIRFLPLEIAPHYLPLGNGASPPLHVLVSCRSQDLLLPQPDTWWIHKVSPAPLSLGSKNCKYVIPDLPKVMLPLPQREVWDSEHNTQKPYGEPERWTDRETDLVWLELHGMHLLHFPDCSKR